LHFTKPKIVAMLLAITMLKAIYFR